MKTLTLNPTFHRKLARLTDKVGDLTYLGADLNIFADLRIVAVVGTRKPTPYGKLMTEKIVGDLARAGVATVSGLAFGVDCLAHEATMNAGGKTIAVSPGGLNKIYPVSNKPTADKILDSGGTIISEYAPDRQPKKVEFLERNRIIAALSDVVIIPEAAAHSGSLNTAMHARKMGIPICVVPGNVTSPMSTGTNHLLKTGAGAITEATDVLQILGIDADNKQLTLDLIGQNPAETIILQKISLGFSEPHSLHVETMLDTVEFQTTITMLEVQGRLTSDSLGNWHIN